MSSNIPSMIHANTIIKKEEIDGGGGGKLFES